jgi:hypothetical protein
LASAIKQSMAKEPAGRFPSLSEFCAAIAPFGTSRAADLAKSIHSVLIGQSRATRPGDLDEDSMADSWSHAPSDMRGAPTTNLDGLGQGEITEPQRSLPQQPGEVTAPATPFGQEVAAIRARIAREGGLDHAREQATGDSDRVSAVPNSSNEETRKFAPPEALRLIHREIESASTASLDLAAHLAPRPPAAAPTPAPISNEPSRTTQKAIAPQVRRGLSQTVPMKKDAPGMGGSSSPSALAAASVAAAAMHATPSVAVVPVVAPPPPASNPGSLAWTNAMDATRGPLPTLPNDDDTGDTRLEPAPKKSGSSIWVWLAVAVAALVIGAVIAFVVLAPGKTTKSNRGKTTTSAEP